MAAKYQVMSIPLLLSFEDVKVIDQSTGAVPESEVPSKIQLVLRHT